MASAVSRALRGSHEAPARAKEGFFAWWGAELANLWPSRRRGLPRDGYVLAIYEGAALHFAACGRGDIEDLGVVDCPPADAGRPLERNADLLAAQIRKSGLPLVLRLAPDLGLMTFDRLPQAARKELRRIVANRLDGLTPWNAETACFDLPSVGRTADGMLDIELAVAPRRTVDRAIAALARLDLEPDIVDLADAADRHAPPTHDLGHAGRTRRLPGYVPLLGGFLLFAGLAAGIFAFFDLQARRAVLAQRQGYALMLEQRLADLPELRTRIDALRNESRAVLDRHLAVPSALVTIETLSRVLPDTVWIENLTLSERQVSLSGYSTDATQLPSLLEASTVFTAARFASPSERLLMPKGTDSFVEVDRFSLQADVRPEAALTP